MTRKEIRSFLESDLISTLTITPEFTRKEKCYHWQKVFSADKFIEFARELRKICGKDIFRAFDISLDTDGSVCYACEFNFAPANIKTWEEFLDLLHKEDCVHD